MGEKLPEKKKKIKVELKKGQKDWGRGMGCMGRVRECTIVPPNHRGEVPGIEVGMSWKYRLQVSQGSKYSFTSFYRLLNQFSCLFNYSFIH